MERINNKYIKDFQRLTKEVLQMGPSGELIFGIKGTSIYTEID